MRRAALAAAAVRHLKIRTPGDCHYVPEWSLVQRDSICMWLYRDSCVSLFLNFQLQGSIIHLDLDRSPARTRAIWLDLIASCTIALAWRRDHSRRPLRTSDKSLLMGHTRLVVGKVVPRCDALIINNHSHTTP